jgi:hypothetical protein
LRVIQNYENRREIFKDGKKFNSNKTNNQEIEIDQDLTTLIEIESDFDNKTWNELLNDIAHKIGESFVNSTIEV